MTTLLIHGAFSATQWIVPGAVWTDTDGKKIDAHGGGVIKRGDTFYWIGQSRDGAVLRRHWPGMLH